MPNDLLIGNGVIFAGTASQVRYSLEIRPRGIFVFAPGRAGAPLSPFDVPEWRTGAGGRGQLILSALPATPQDAFYEVSWSLAGDTFTLTVNREAAFSPLPNGSFRQLRLTFRQKRGGALSVEGGVTFVVFDADVPLTATLDAASGLMLSYRLADPVAIPPVGQAEGVVLEVAARYERWRDVQALYLFDELTGSVIRDRSGAEPPFDLTIGKTDGLTRADDALLFNGKAADAAGGSARGREAITASQELTLEVWLTPRETALPLGATIVSLTTPRRNNVLSLVQAENKKQLLITGDFFLSADLPDTPAGAPVLVTFTRNREGQERLFINGVERASRVRAEPLRTWEGELVLTLGHFPNQEDYWSGKLHQVAFFSRALPPDEVRSHYVQAIRMEGRFRIAEAPAPLDRALPAAFDLFADPATIRVDHEEALGIRPELDLAAFHLQWSKKGNAAWSLGGTVTARFWQAATTLAAALGGTKTKPVLTLASPDGQSTAFSAGGWGDMAFTSLLLKAARAGWTLSSTSTPPFFALPTPRGRPFDLLAELPLADPALGLDADHLLLHGRWLGEALAFRGERHGGILVLRAAASFALPFSLRLPPLHDPRTGARIAEAIHIERETMHISLDVELDDAGVRTLVLSHFAWTDPAGVRQQINLPPFTLYSPPPTKNAVLGAVVAELRARAGELFADQGKNAADYYLDAAAAVPTLHFSASASPAGEIQSILPPLFDGDAAVEIKTTPDVFLLRQARQPDAAGNSVLQTTLTIKVKNRTPDAIAGAARQLWQSVLARPTLLPGAAAVLRRRIAERLPLPYEQLLAYHYGWTPAGNAVDLLPGMRLRVDFQNYQFVQPSDAGARRGFAGSGSTCYYVNSYRHHRDGRADYLLGFDAFLSLVQAETDPAVIENGAGSVLDVLQRPDSRRAHYRLVYPPELGTGVGPERVATVFGADRPDWWLDDAAGGAINFYFRGKATVVPEIQVFLREQAVYVPVGATLRQLIERSAGLPAALPGQDLRDFLGAARPLRLIHEGVNSKPSYVFLNLAPYRAYDNGLDILDLPVLQGDRYYF